MDLLSPVMTGVVTTRKAASLLPSATREAGRKGFFPFARNQNLSETNNDGMRLFDVYAIILELS